MAAQPVANSNSHLPAEQKLHSYYTINLNREKLKHDAMAVVWGFVIVASIVAAVGASVFLFTLSIDAIIYIPYIAGFTVYAIKSKLEGNYNEHASKSEFLKQLIEKKPQAEIRCIRRHPNVTEDQARLISARYLVVQEAVNQRFEKFGEAWSSFESASGNEKYQFIPELITSKMKLKEGLKELDFISHLINNPFEEMASSEKYIPSGGKNIGLYQRVESLAITVQ